ncbi:ribose transport system substrate-binding protein [Catalinimonas alkaloidigena]|uniref:substrate-binding domain-containing protein n=1 Tax=Catalinimonas alkaloidigena TaxID=1075417 RepID=UPI002406C64E|nr:substrate-binding domain-containing protein [Catalinimonas alkaloidigena]MDF9796554.1 ribose transport system substrate-binding protein [Catalinimonas alkaloidigena]
MKIILRSILLLFVILSACDPKKGALYKQRQLEKQQTPAVEINEDEEYVMVTTIVNFPMYVNHDQAAFQRWGRARGVKTSILGPSEWDVQAQIATIEQVIGTRPTGLLINGTDPAIAGAINKAVEAGIPTVVYDSDIPNSERHAFLGTDWYQIGKLQGEAMVELIGGKGKVAYMGILGMTNMEAGFQGLLDVLKNYPEIEVVGKYDDGSDVEEAARITSDLLSAHPDLAGICGFDAMSGPGIGLSIKEAGKAGKVKVTTVDWEPEHIKLVQEGVIDVLIGQKRELFTWYGAQFLFDMVHDTNPLSSNDDKAGITNIPYSVNTGLLKITQDNIHLFMEDHS